MPLSPGAPKHPFVNAPRGCLPPGRGFVTVAG